jgi:hypothetical protein
VSCIPAKEFLNSFLVPASNKYCLNPRFSKRPVTVYNPKFVAKAVTLYLCASDSLKSISSYNS